MSIFLPYNVPSSKNSRINTSRGSFPSATVSRYLRALGIQSYSASRKEVIEYKTRPNVFKSTLEDYFKDVNEIEIPIKIGFHFIRGTRHKFDFHNAIQIIADLLTAHGFIEDDNMDYLIPFPLELEGKYYSYDKENPGVIIKILK